MRFILINQFYPPDVAPTGKYLHDLAKTIVQRGHEVEVFCSRRSYDGGKSFARREIMEGVNVTRLFATGFGRRGFAGKLADYISFYFSLLLALMFVRRRPDLILSLTTPPYAGLLGKLAAQVRGSRHAHWVMDLYPDVMRANQKSSGGAGLRWLQRLTRFQFQGATQIFALGPVMAASVSAYVNSAKTTVTPMPLWSDAELSPWPAEKPNALRAERGWRETVFLYSGNMGLGHRFGEFLAAAKKLGPEGPRWVFAGGGKRRAEIEAFARLNSGSKLSFLDYVPHEKLREHLTAADVHLASLDAGWQGCMVPSKLQGSFAVGRPVLYVGGDNCETALWIRESGGGWVVAENDIEGLLTAVAQALNAEERHRRGRAAWDFARRHFQTSVNCAEMARLLETAK